MYGGRYGFLRYGLQDNAETEFEFEFLASDALKCTIGSGMNIIAGMDVTAALNAIVGITRGVPFAAELAAELAATIAVEANVIVTITATDGLDCAVYAAKDINTALELVDMLSCALRAGKDTPAALNTSAALNCIAHSGKNISMNYDFTAALGAYIDAAVYDEEICVINATIPAGGELRIDSDNYTVTLNGENIIHLHSGDFIFLARDTIDITLTSGTSGNVTGRIQHNAKYL